MTVVKVQRPIFTSGLEPDYKRFGGPWLIYDKFRARECTLDAVPVMILKAFNSAPPEHVDRYRQYFEDAIWDPESEVWNLSEATPVTRRLIW